ncbi:TetR/AcrR family transcriptional regulator [Clostridium algoriphilum]|uniref:TetR/AcrR family transcriptional regulator n=1 Tax=Clostridium algoriphilum TaxID=198347 RepID=UPI001CF32ADD|nr:TetR/AcrR family transcriptional regulator [Clostridium algoriphilum]MCB2294215.1 TetR/AcrR family transcriptional regulator [Clostridium algoriphilum]
MSIREKNKKYYRDKILATSKEVFTSQGFENTTIEQIAEKAGIGIGTAYNYFKSKEELFILSMAEDVATNIEDSLEDFEYTESDVSEIVAEAILKHIRKMNWINKKIWKVAFSIILGSMKSDKMPIKEVLRADFKTMDKIRDLINQLKVKNLLTTEFDTTTAIDLIFGALFLQMSMYVYTDDSTFEQTCERIKTDIRFVFDGKEL